MANNAVDRKLWFLPMTSIHTAVFLSHVVYPSISLVFSTNFCLTGRENPMYLLKIP